MRKIKMLSVPFLFAGALLLFLSIMAWEIFDEKILGTKYETHYRNM